MNNHIKFKTIALSVLMTVSLHSTFAQQMATTIYSNYNNFTISSNKSPVAFDDSNILLGFAIGESVYSTDVNNQALDDNGVNYTPSIFQAFTTPSGLKYKSSDVGVANNWGEETQDGSKSDYIKKYEPLGYEQLMEDGANGLESSTCVFKIDNQNIIYSIENIAEDKINDETPDIIIAETGQPTGLDRFYLVDANGNRVGEEIRYSLNKTEIVGTVDWTVYQTKNGRTKKNPKQRNEDLRLLTFKLNDFKLDEVDADKVVGFVRYSSGHADNAFTAYNKESINIIEQVLPIEMTYFEGVVEGQEIILDWATASETNNDFFTIERSNDGINFESIGEKNGAGNTTEQQEYRFIDNTPNSGINYYRIKQTDYDGTFSYSDVIALKIKTPETTVTVYPNPFVEDVNIQVEDTKKRSVMVYDLTGKLIKATSFTGNTTLNFRHLPAGTYALNIKTENGKNQSQLIMKQ